MSQSSNFRRSNLKELEAVNAGSAVLCNRFYVTTGDGIARITFIEETEGGDIQFRSAICMSDANLEQFRDLLIQICEAKTPSAKRKHN